MVLPYAARAHEGCERLAAAVRGPRRFVAARVALNAAGLVITPAAVVVDKEGHRSAFMPWVDRGVEEPTTTADGARPIAPARRPIEAHIAEVTEGIAALLHIGLRRGDDVSMRRLRTLAIAGEALGLGRLPDGLGQLAALLEAGLRDPRWDPGPAARLACELAVWCRLAPEVS